jgi:hypothetical protein
VSQFAYEIATENTEETKTLRVVAELLVNEFCLRLVFTVECFAFLVMDGMMWLWFMHASG